MLSSSLASCMGTYPWGLQPPKNRHPVACALSHTLGITFTSLPSNRRRARHQSFPRHRKRIMRRGASQQRAIADDDSLSISDISHSSEDQQQRGQKFGVKNQPPVGFRSSMQQQLATQGGLGGGTSAFGSVAGARPQQGRGGMAARMGAQQQQHRRGEEDDVDEASISFDEEDEIEADIVVGAGRGGGVTAMLAGNTARAQLGRPQQPMRANVAAAAASGGRFVPHTGRQQQQRQGANVSGGDSGMSLSGSLDFDSGDIEVSGAAVSGGARGRAGPAAGRFGAAAAKGRTGPGPSAKRRTQEEDSFSVSGSIDLSDSGEVIGREPKRDAGGVSTGRGTASLRSSGLSGKPPVAPLPRKPPSGLSPGGESASFSISSDLDF